MVLEAQEDRDNNKYNTTDPNFDVAGESIDYHFIGWPYEKRKEMHMCPQCGRALPDDDTEHVLCPICRMKKRSHAKQMYEEWSEAGVCRRCGEPAVPGKTLCSWHLAYTSKKQKEYRKRAKERRKKQLPED